MNNLKALSIVAATGLAFTAPTYAAIITYNNANATGLWNDAGNWDLLREPTTGDDVVLNGNTLSVTATSTFGEFHTTGGNGTVNIDSGGELTGLEDYSLRYATINVNNGGTFNAPAFNVRANINVKEGGTLNGVISIGVQDARTISVEGTMNVRGTSNGANKDFKIGSGTGANDGVLNVKSTGKVILDIFSNGVNEYFNVTGLDTQNKLSFESGSAIELRPQDGYVPQMGDSFDLLEVVTGSSAQLLLSGVTGNITISGVPGTIDTSAWESTGVVTVVPEPASMALLSLGAAFMLRRRTCRR